jgi:hypothetical protein
MYRVISQIKPLPGYDLFNYSLPVPLRPALDNLSPR